MSVTKEDIKYISHLARLEMKEEEIENFTAQINKILQYFQKLQQLDTEGIKPASHAIPVYNVFREDKVQLSDNISLMLSNAPSQDENYFIVPRVIE